MGYTQAQAKKLARQIFDRFDKRIFEACHGTNVPPRFLAGLIGNEAGKDKKGQIVEEATRFEPHVFSALKSIRDKGYRIASGKRQSTYNGITQAQIADASDEALRALSISYGASQIMGWHVINNLHCTIADLRNPDKHFFYTVKLLQLNGFPKNATKAQMDNEMRQWNTGREQGETYHESYVPNATLVRAEYAVLEEDRLHRPVDERVNVSIEDIDANALEEILDSTAELSSDSQPTTGPAGPNSVETSGEEAGQPAPDPAGEKPSFFLNVEDWKPFVSRWLKRAWAGATGVTIPGGGALGLAALNDPDRWHIYAGIAVVGLLLVIGFLAIVTIGLGVVLFVNRKEIVHYITESVKSQANPAVETFALKFEKK